MGRRPSVKIQTCLPSSGLCFVLSFTRTGNDSILRPRNKPVQKVNRDRFLPMPENTPQQMILSHALLKAGGLVLFACAAILSFKSTSLKVLMDPDALNMLIDRAGPWGPAAYIGITAVSICLFVPASIPVIAGGIIFGPFKGFFYVLTGCAAGASGAFLIGRSLGRDFIRKLMGRRIRGYDAAIRKNGFLTVFYLRILNFPFTPLNFGLGLTSVRFKDYLIGTALGVAVSVFVLTFLGGVLREAWVSGRWHLLLSGKSLAAAGLYTASVLIPLLVRKWKYRE
jgi:uncharacterized membrane protein YdjX (TVP38/TMEM64 family)